MGRALAIIPARGGSKGIPRKNLVDVGGKPLLVHSIEHALSSPCIDRVIVSTDDAEIAQVAVAHGAEVPFLRPAELAADHTLDLPVFQHVLRELQLREGYAPQLVVHLRPTAPYRKRGWIDEAVALLESRAEADSVRSVSLVSQHPYRVFEIGADGMLAPVMSQRHPQPFLLRRQDLPPMYYYNCVIDVTRPNTIFQLESMTGQHMLPYVMDPDDVIDIDTKRDLAIARAVFWGDAVKLLVIGAGMYVTGRGTADPGTVLLSLAQVAARLPIEEVVVCANKPESAADVERCAQQIKAALGRDLPVHYESASAVLQSAGLSQRFAGCIVSVPDHLHHSIGMRVLDAGLNCLMVKPLAPTLREVDELIALQQQRGLYCAVELHKRFDEGNLVVRRLIREGALGRLSHISVEYSQRMRIPRDVFASWSSKTNIFQYLGVHYVDLVYFLTGFLPQRALAYGTRGILSAQGIDTYDSVHALVEWRNPADNEQRLLAQYAIGWIDPDTSSALSDQKFSLVGARGRVDCDQKNRGVTLTRAGGGIEAINPYFARVLSTMDGNELSGYGYQSIERFVLDLDDLRAGRTTVAKLEAHRPTFRDARAATAVIEAVNASLADGASWKDAHVTS